MIEVFKTNITKGKRAKKIIEKLFQKFPYYQITFDIEDCDKILRVENPKGHIDSALFITSVHDLGFYSEVLSDT